MKRFISAVLCGVLVLGMVPVPALAASEPAYTYDSRVLSETVLAYGFSGDFTQAYDSGVWDVVRQELPRRVGVYRYQTAAGKEKQVYVEKMYTQGALSSNVKANYYSGISAMAMTANQQFDSIEATRVAVIFRFAQNADFAQLTSVAGRDNMGVYTSGELSFQASSGKVVAPSEDVRPKGSGYFPAYYTPHSEVMGVHNDTMEKARFGSRVGEDYVVVGIWERLGTSGTFTNTRTGFIRWRPCASAPDGKVYRNTTMAGTPAVKVSPLTVAAADGAADEPPLWADWKGVTDAQGKWHNGAIFAGGAVPNPDPELVAAIDHVLDGIDNNRMDAALSGFLGSMVLAGTEAEANSYGAGSPPQTIEASMPPVPDLGLGAGGMQQQILEYVKGVIGKVVGGITGLFLPVSLLKDFLEE